MGMESASIAKCSAGRKGLGKLARYHRSHENVLGWDHLAPPQNPAEAYSVHRAMYEAARFEFCKGIPQPAMWYAATVECHDVEVRHAPEASEQPSRATLVSVRLRAST